MRSKELVRLWKRPSKDGRSFTYYLRYYNMENKEQVQSLQHADGRKAEKQRLAKEKELRMGFCPSGTMRLREFVTDSLERTGSNIRPSTREEYQSAMDDFIKVNQRPRRTNSPHLRKHYKAAYSFTGEMPSWLPLCLYSPGPL